MADEADAVASGLNVAHGAFERNARLFHGEGDEASLGRGGCLASGCYQLVVIEPLQVIDDFLALADYIDARALRAGLGPLMLQ